MNEPTTRTDWDIDYIFKLTEPIVIAPGYVSVIHVSRVEVLPNNDEPNRA